MKSKGTSLINILGLSIGLGVVLIIGLWIYDELTYNNSLPGNKFIVQVLQNQTNNGKTETQEATPCLLADELKKSYGDDFKYMAQASWNYEHLITYNKNHFKRSGSYCQMDFLEILSIEMLSGVKSALDDPYSFLLSQSTASSIFGSVNPIGKIVKLDNYRELKVAGVYKDLPENTEFNEHDILLSWKLFLLDNSWISSGNSWGSNFTRAFGLLNKNRDIGTVSQKIKNTIYNNADEGDKKAKPEIFLFPMNRWHLYSGFENGKNVGGSIKYVWLFGMIGLFVLLLACINFINLSTARSEKRAREVGILKTLGSAKNQLVTQFLTESFTLVFFAFTLSLVLTYVSLPFFNDIAFKNLHLPFSQTAFWVISICFCVIVSLLAGIYPAFYLSSFNPIKVLKGSLHTGKAASLPRKVLVVFQFTVSVALLTSTWIVYKQIQYAKNRPEGFNKNSLITTGFYDRIYTSFDAFGNDLKSSGAVLSIAQSTSPPAQVWRTNGGFNWKGKDPSFAVDFPNNAVSYDYGKTIGWEIIRGRDFSQDFKSDSNAMIITAKTAQVIGIENPVGETIWWNESPYQIVGIANNIMVGSPYAADQACIYHIAKEQENVINMRLNTEMNTREALSKIEAVYKKYAPGLPFDYTFIDAEFAKKFGEEERIGKLSSLFTYLAMFISILGLLGLTVYSAEKRTKEIGIRKVLGASVAGIWRLLSAEFIKLTFISFLIAIPVSYFFMVKWLQNFEYRTSISSWIYIAIGVVTLLLTIAVISFQTIKAAVANPVKSLRTE